jgi:hypothetical protein
MKRVLKGPGRGFQSAQERYEESKEGKKSTASPLNFQLSTFSHLDTFPAMSKMNMLFPERTTAGISHDSNGERVVAGSRRADGRYVLALLTL